ncbi:MAG: LemA family protein [Longicatena sp.]
MQIALIVVLVIVVLLIAYIVATYNKFVKMANKVEEAFSGIMINRLANLIPNLIETIKGYTKHEAETLEKVISARNMAVQAQSMDEKIQTEKNFQSMLGPLYAISEQYPNLKADQHFTELQKELQKIETEIANSRKFYNAVCVKFNNLVEMFPSNLLAQMFHQTKKPLYEIENVAQRENVKVQF